MEPTDLTQSLQLLEAVSLCTVRFSLIDFNSIFLFSPASPNLEEFSLLLKKDISSSFLPISCPMQMTTSALGVLFSGVVVSLLRRNPRLSSEGDKLARKWRITQCET